MKRRSLTVLLCLLAIISLASVGFAAWVISAGDTEEVTGNVQVDTVSDQRLVIKVTSGEQNLNFLASAEEISGAWLTSDSKEKEDLEIVLTFTLEYADKNATTAPKDAVVKVEWDKPTSEKLDAALTAGYIAEVPKATVTSVEVGKTITYTAKINFKWGTAFGGKNPYTYYNELDVETAADVAFETLTNLYTMFAPTTTDENGTELFKYGIVITATPASQVAGNE